MSDERDRIIEAARAFFSALDVDVDIECHANAVRMEPRSSWPDSSWQITFANLRDLADAVGTDRINLRYEEGGDGWESCPGGGNEFGIYILTSEAP